MGQPGGGARASRPPEQTLPSVGAALERPLELHEALKLYDEGRYDEARKLCEEVVSVLAQDDPRCEEACGPLPIRQGCGGRIESSLLLRG